MLTSSLPNSKLFFQIFRFWEKYLLLQYRVFEERSPSHPETNQCFSFIEAPSAHFASMIWLTQDLPRKKAVRKAPPRHKYSDICPFLLTKRNIQRKRSDVWSSVVPAVESPQDIVVS